MSRELDALRDRSHQAEFPGRCNLCQEQFDEGTWIVRYEEHWVHLDCAEEEVE